MHPSKRLSKEHHGGRKDLNAAEIISLPLLQCASSLVLRFDDKNLSLGHRDDVGPTQSGCPS